MKRYCYRALTAGGELQRGQMQAQDESALSRQLAMQGLELISARVTWWGPTRVPMQERITLFFNLAQLARAGIPLLDSLHDLRDSSTHPLLRVTLSGVLNAIQNGQSLSQAMQLHPDVFSATEISLVQAGEVSGELPAVFADLTEDLKWQDEISAQARSALLYPLLLLLVMTAVLLFLLLYLVPQLTTFMRSMGQQLTWQLRMLLGLSDFLRHGGAWWLPLLLLPLPLPLWQVVQRDPAWRKRRDAWLLRCWGLGNVLQKLLLARLMRHFALMYRAGISILDSLRVLPGVLGNLALAGGVRQAAQAIANGQPLAASFAQTGLFPPLVIRMLKVGESTGVLDEALLNISYFYQREARQAVQRWHSLLEPLMTLLLGVLLGWVMLAVLGPVYDLMTAMGGL